MNPLHAVVESTADVTRTAEHLTIATDRLRDAAATAPKLAVPRWDAPWYYRGSPDDVAAYYVVLDALNFSFWPDHGQAPWTVAWNGKPQTGAIALTCALTTAMQGGARFADAGFLRDLSPERLGAVLGGEGVLPMLSERTALLRDLGQQLAADWDGSFLRVIHAAQGSAARLVSLLARFAAFRDVESYRGRPVYFYKKAQLLVSMLAGAFDGAGPGAFTDLDQLTAYADYRLPQTLRALGILEYAPALAALVDREQDIPDGAEAEVELRAATVVAGQRLRDALAELGAPADTRAIDYWLWLSGRNPALPRAPHHRTRTINY